MAAVRNTISGGNIDRKFLETMLIRIQFYQHERLVHLIVTMVFALMTVLSLSMLLAGNSFSLVLSLLFLALTIPYVVHYYFLENSVQHLYKMYYEAMAKIND